MKKLIFFAIASMFAIASCTNEAIDEVAEEPIVPESTAAPVLYASFESNEVESKAGFTYDGAGHYDHYWNAGDHIYVFNKNNDYDIYNCTDASAGVFSLVKDRTDGSAVSKVYAVYYSTLTDNGNKIDDPLFLHLYTSPSLQMSAYIDWEYSVAGPDKNGAYGYNNLMVAAADNTDEKLVFKSAFGWLKLQLKGTQKVKSITVHSIFDNILDYNSTSTVNIGNLTGTPETGFDYYDTKDRRLNIAAPYAQLNTVTATDFYITLPPCTMSKGFKVIIDFADGTSNEISTSEKSFEIKRNIVTTLPEITVGTTISNLSSSGTANTYIVQSAGNKKFDATVKGSSSESVGTPVRAAVLWESFNTSTTPSVGDLVTNVTYSDGYVYFRVPFTNTGNAVIAVYDSSDNILWSWLIWVTDISGLTTPEDLSSFVSGFKLMKRPIGVVEDGGRGLYYQWGRKDPFYMSTASVSIKGTYAQKKSTSQSSIENSIKNPTTFYYYTSNYIWENTSSTTLWRDDAKTIYDPCPPGWKVASGDKLKAAISNGYSNGVNSTSVFNPYGALILSAGDFNITATNRYWTSSAKAGGVGIVTNSLSLGDGVALSVVDDTGTAVGYQVRCEKM